MGEEVKEVVASLGYTRAQDLVGRYDLLEQVAMKDKIDLTPLISPLEEYLDLEPLDLPVAEGEEDTRAEAGLVVARPIRMEAKAASAEIAKLAPEICGGTTLRSEFPGPPTPTTACSAPSSRGRSPARGSSKTARSPTTKSSPASSSTAARSPARASARSTPTGSRCGSRAVPRTASARRCWAARSRSSRARGRRGKRVNGSVGKSFAYGAQRGKLYVQGSADSRFCIRLSGADVVLAGEPQQDIDDARGCIVDRANVKGFAFEYMTSGRAIVLGDIGPWACAGMTGGRVYVRFNAFGIDPDGDRTAARPRRQSRAERPRPRGACSTSRSCSPATPRSCGRPARTRRPQRMLDLAEDATSNFLMVIPRKVQADPSISTE